MPDMRRDFMLAAQRRRSHGWESTAIATAAALRRRDEHVRRLLRDCRTLLTVLELGSDATNARRCLEETIDDVEAARGSTVRRAARGGA